MKQYLDLMRHVRENGNKKEDRTGTGTLSVFGYQMRFDLSEGFPMVTTKKCHLKSIIHELLWFLSGDTNIKYLQDNGVRIWNEGADEDGNLGPVYGYQWRSWPAANGTHVDQISQVIEQIKNTPNKTSELKNMKDMVGEAVNIINGNIEHIEDFGKLLDESWEIKRSLSSRVSTTAIDEMYSAALKAGALGGKICGAGGGGFMLLFVPPRKQRLVRKTLKDLLYVPFRFESLGSQIILYADQEPY